MNDKQIENLALILTLVDESITGGKVRKAFNSTIDKFLEEKTIYIDGEPLTQEKFDYIYKSYKDSVITKEVYTKYKTSILLALKNCPELIDQMITTLLNIKEN